MQTTQTFFRPVPFILCMALGLAILASWLVPATHEYWRQLDEYWFFTANGSLNTGSEAWRVFWAIANYRAFDVLPASLLLGIFLLSAFRDHRSELSNRFAICVFMVFCYLITIQITRLFVQEGRLSPTMVLSPAYLLTEMVPWIATKDRATYSFPSDHAMAMCMVACLTYYFCGKRYGVWSFLVATIFCIPRTVGGAHWISDVIVGMIAIPLIAMPIAIFTPLGGYIITWFQKISEPLLKRFLPKFFK